MFKNSYIKAIVYFINQCYNSYKIDKYNKM